MLYVNNQPIKFIMFPNLEKRLDLPKEILDRKEGIINHVQWYYENDASIFELLLLDDAIHSYTQLYELYIGYMPYSRMDRTNAEGTAQSHLQH